MASLSARSATDQRNDALDGLRGVSIVLVVLYHAFPDLVSGGYVGVSVFFTVSGYLITSRLFVEIAQHGRVDVGAFWGRRVRRLLPAAAVTIGGTVVALSWLGDLTSTDVDGAIASAAYVTNWWQLAGGDGYGALFERANPLDHFWSLAIEEQFYLVFPIVLLFASSARRLALIASAVTVASVVGPLLAGWGFERRYLGTDARLGEIAVGVVLACVLGAASSSRARRVAESLAAPALLSIIAMGLFVAYGSGFWRFGFLPVSAATAVVITAVVVSDRGVTVLLRWRPLAATGVLSYSWYLVHWPILVLVEPNGWVATIVTVAVSFAVAVLLHRLVERPIIRIAPATSRSALAGVAMSLVAVGALVAVRPEPTRVFADDIQQIFDEYSEQRTVVPDAPASTEVTPTTNREEATKSTVTSTVTSTAPSTAAAAATTTTTTSEPALVPRLGFTGDSVALTSAFAFGRFGDEDRSGIELVDGAFEIGCGMSRFGDDYDSACPEPVSIATSVPAGARDVAVVMSCQWELLEREFPDGETLIITDDRFAEHVRADYGRVVDALVSSGVSEVWWATCPALSTIVVPDRLRNDLAESRDPVRVAALNEVVQRLAAERDSVRVFDLAETFGPRIDDAALRPDGSHFEFESDVGVAAILEAEIAEMLRGSTAPTRATVGPVSS